MNDNQLLVLAIAIVFPISVLIYQVGTVAAAIRELERTIRTRNALKD